MSLESEQNYKSGKIWLKKFYGVQQYSSILDNEMQPTMVSFIDPSKNACLLLHKKKCMVPTSSLLQCIPNSRKTLF